MHVSAGASLEAQIAYARQRHDFKFIRLSVTGLVAVLATDLVTMKRNHMALMQS